MARTNATAVKILIETDLSDADVDAFIDDAATWITVSGAEDATCHTSESLTALEKYLAAHLVALRERQLTSEKAGDATDQYGGEFGMALKFTQYGQMAIAYDCSGLIQGSTGTPFTADLLGGAGS